jgi:hypothetical protein
MKPVPCCPTLFSRYEVTHLCRINGLLKMEPGELYIDNNEFKNLEWLSVRRIIKIKKYIRFNQQEKHEIIVLVDGSDQSANRTFKELRIHKRILCKWYKRYPDKGIDGMAPSDETNTSASAISSVSLSTG